MLRADALHQLGERGLELGVAGLGAVEGDEQLLGAVVALAGLLEVAGLAGLLEDRVQDLLDREGVHRELEADLVDEGAAVAAAGLEVLELALDDGEVVLEHVVEVAGEGGVGQGHVSSSVGGVLSSGARRGASRTWRLTTWDGGGRPRRAAGPSAA